MRRTSGVVLVLVLLAAACGGGGTPIDKIGAGDCFDDPGSATIKALDVLDCAEPHDNEVFAEVFMTEGTFPGEDVVGDFAFEECYDEFERYVGESYLDSPLDYFYLGPTEESWNNGDNGVLCVLYSADLVKLSSSMQGSG